MTQRPIKFRVWDDSKRQMFYGHLGEEWIVLNLSGTIYKGIGFSPTPDYSLALSQFTGLHDKNGKEIWESDVVTHLPLKEKLRVDFWQGMFVGYCADGHRHFIGNEQEYIGEVIGNIYENPDLIKEIL